MARQDRGRLEEVCFLLKSSRDAGQALQISLTISADSLVNKKESVPGARLFKLQFFRPWGSA